MIYTLSNNFLTVSINSLGAEFEQILINNKNVLWQRNDVWKRQSPLLFPMIGKTLDGYYTYKNIKYTMKTNHGFAHLMDFSLVETTEDSITLEISDTVDTLKIYPFNFTLQVTYKLLNNKIETTWNVINKTNGPILFNIGGHPAFVLDNKNYQIAFDTNTNLNYYTLSNGLVSNQKQTDDKSLIINAHEHINEITGAIIFPNLNSATLISNKQKIKIETKNTNYLAFWQKPDNRYFLCLEPWCGLPDVVNHNHKLEDKHGIITLKTSEIHTSGYTLTFDI